MTKTLGCGWRSFEKAAAGDIITTLRTFQFDWFDCKPSFEKFSFENSKSRNSFCCSLAIYLISSEDYLPSILSLLYSLKVFISISCALYHCCINFLSHCQTCHSSHQLLETKANPRRFAGSQWALRDTARISPLKTTILRTFLLLRIYDSLHYSKSGNVQHVSFKYDTSLRLVGNIYQHTSLPREKPKCWQIWAIYRAEVWRV